MLINHILRRRLWSWNKRWNLFKQFFCHFPWMKQVGDVLHYYSWWINKALHLKQSWAPLKSSIQHWSVNWYYHTLAYIHWYITIFFQLLHKLRPRRKVRQRGEDGSSSSPSMVCSKGLLVWLWNHTFKRVFSKNQSNPVS